MIDWKQIKTMAIYGAGLEAEKFYCQYRKKYNILYVIDNYKIGSFHELPILTIEQSKKMEPVDIIVITPIEPKYAIADDLYEIGYKYGKDYCFSEDIGKQICIMYGNCHFAYIEEELKCNSYFRSRYAIHYYFVFVGEKKEQLRMPTTDILAECDLFISQDIKSENKARVPGYSELEKYLSDTCIRIIVPNLYGVNLFFPQLELRDNVDESLLKIHFFECNDERRKMYSRIISGIKGHTDVNIEKWILEGECVEKIRNYIEKEEIYSKDIVLRNFREQIEKLKVREEKCSISISDFLLDNYKKEKLFFEPYHPTRIVLREKTKRILKKLNIEYVPHGKLIGADDSYEVFVYECVAQALGVEWRDQLIRNCRVEYTLYNRSINLEEYINQYMLWSEEIETTNIHI